MKLQQFKVYMNSKHVDTLFFPASMKITRDEVRRSLVRHDGYDPRIRIVKARTK